MLLTKFSTVAFMSLAILLVSFSALGSEKPTLQELEDAYWKCEEAAAVTTLNSSQAAFCSAVFEELKREKFGGDFSKFYRWWQQNNKKIKRDKDDRNP